MPYDELGNFISPTLDEMRYELSLPETVRQMVHSKANALPTREQMANVAKGFASAGESLGRGFVAGIPGVFGDINALAREYVTPHLPEKVQQVLEQAPAAPTTEQYLSHIPRVTERFGDETANRAVETLGSAFSPDVIVPAAKFVGKAAAERIMEGENLIPGVPASVTNPHLMYAVKPEKGGNWINESIESALSPLKGKPEEPIDVTKRLSQDAGNTIRYNYPQVDEAYTQHFRGTGKHSMYYGEDYWPWMEKNFPEEYKAVIEGKTPGAYLNRWVDKKLAPYIKNELATPNDPLRELAERGVSHMPERPRGEYMPVEPTDLIVPETYTRREAAGLPKEGFAKTPLGQQWEHYADQAVRSRSAKMHVQQGESANPYESAKWRLERNPWLKDVPPDTPVYHASSSDELTRGLGFDHLMDELRNAIDPNSGLPEHLRLKPEQLDKVTVPQAVERVAKINDWRLAQTKKAAKEDLKDFPVAHEDPSGYKIHELKLPENLTNELPEGHSIKALGPNSYALIDKEGKQRFSTTGSEEQAFQEFNNRLNYEKLDKALKNEGEQMGHCVGGYTDSVAEGRTRIFSLRDPDGGAHATIEVRPHVNSNYDPKNIPDDIKAQHEQYALDETLKAGYKEGTEPFLHHYTGVMIQEGSKYLKENPRVTLNVEQIKGKGNKEVSDKYRTYIKDWLNKEHTKIDKIEDLDNVGLVDLSSPRSLIRELKDMYGDDGIHLYNAAVDANPNIGTRFVSREDLRNYIEAKPEPTFNFDSVKISELKKPIKVYHASDVEPMISTAEKRLIPESISTNINSPNYAWGGKGYSLEIPAGAKVGKLKNIEDLNPEGADITRIDLGKALRRYATENNLDAVFIKNVPGTAGEGEWAIFNPDYIKDARHYDSNEKVFKKNETVPEVIEQKMLQGIYRGYAGENPASAQEGSIYASPQRAVGEYYANKRAKQTGEEPHVEMLLVDPFKGREYGHATAGTGKQLPLVTRARQLNPEEIVSSTKLYKKGGHVAKKPVYFADDTDAMRHELLRNK